MIRPQVLQPALGSDVNWFAGLVLGIRLDADDPVGHIHKNAGDRDRIRAWVDQTRDVLAIPVHDECDLVPLGWRWTPVAGPGARQRVSLLRLGWREKIQARPQATPKCSSPH